MKKTFSLIILLTLISTFGNFKSSFAQTSFSHSLSAGFILDQDVIAPVLFYSPRFNLVELSDFGSVSLGSHLGVSATEDAVILRVPAMLELNFGLKSTPENWSSIGTFVGIGYGISINSDAYVGEEFLKGVYFNVGTYFLENWGVRIALFNDLDDEKFESLSLSVMYAFD